MGGSRILIIGGTGLVGRYVIKASAALGHPTFVLVRQSTLSDPHKAQLLESFKSLGITIVHGSLEDHESLVEAIQKVDVVISTVGRAQLEDQVNIIKAIKEVGTIKRFLPSEFGQETDKLSATEPLQNLITIKENVRRAIEAEGIPSTYVISNLFAGYALSSLGQQGPTAPPPRDKVIILGDGNAKVVLVKEEDIGTFTIKAVDDPRTLNKTLYVRPPANIFSSNELVALWEKKIGKTLEKVYLSEEQVLKSIEETPYPEKIFKAIDHALFVKGVQTNLDNRVDAVEATELYPDVKYTTVDEYLNQFA